ncbi:MAG: hypothetical protein IIB72_02845, partial [Proteobacteria bacterium]|nr:hypothetical protein [Pseudomonadota bacterium]
MRICRFITSRPIAMLALILCSALATAQDTTGLKQSCEQLGDLSITEITLSLTETVAENS